MNFHVSESFGTKTVACIKSIIEKHQVEERTTKQPLDYLPGLNKNGLYLGFFKTVISYVPMSVRPTSGQTDGWAGSQSDI